MYCRENYKIPDLDELPSQQKCCKKKPPPDIFCVHNRGKEHPNTLWLLQLTAPLEPKNIKSKVKINLESYTSVTIREILVSKPSNKEQNIIVCLSTSKQVH